MKKRKDNLTDIVEQLPKVEVNNNPKPAKNQQVMNSDGELVTLGLKSKHRDRNTIHGNLLELSITKKIEEIVRTETEKVLDKLAKQIVAKIEERLKKDRLLEK